MRGITGKVTSAMAASIALASFIAILARESWLREVMLLVTTVVSLPLWATATAVTTLHGDPIMDGDDDTKALRLAHACFFFCSCANTYLWVDAAAAQGSHENWAAVFLIVFAVFCTGLLLVLGLVLWFPKRTRRLSKQLFIGLGLYVGSWVATLGVAAVLR